MRRKRKAKIKKLIVIITFSLIIIFTFFIVFININHNNKLINNNKDIDIELEVINEEEDHTILNRVTYKEGFYYEDLSDKIIKYITGKSFPKSFDSNYTEIKYEDFSYVKVLYYDFNNVLHDDGELIVNKKVAQDVVEIFYELYEYKYPFTSIKLVENFNADDELSMKNNNTSAFNYRLVEEDDVLSWHAFGIAIDINPLYNPYVLGSNIYPKNALEYVDRTKDFIGKIDKDDICYKIFNEHGWVWGGDFVYAKDYQHFYKKIFLDEIRYKKEVSDNDEIYDNR